MAKQVGNIRESNEIFNLISDKALNEFERIQDGILIGNGNCVNYLTFVKSASVDLVLTDPPYNLGKFMHNRNTNLIKMRKNQFAYSGWDDLSQEEWEREIEGFFYESARILKKNGTLLLFASIIKVETIVKIATRYDFYYKTTGIWHKTNPMPRNMNIHFVNSTEAWIYFINKGTSGTFNNTKIEHDFIESSLTTPREKKFGKHSTQKPIKVISHFIQLLSNENETVLDPFMGSGTTGVCSKKLNRNFIGIDINKKYCELSKNRILNE